MPAEVPAVAPMSGPGGELTTWEQLCGRYDGFIFDQFGVMHNGAACLPGAPELVAQLNASGKRLGILSNSSKRKEWTLAELPKLGFDAAAFEEAAVTTSGEEAWHALGREWHGKDCVWISKSDAPGVSDYLDGTGVGLTGVEDASFILNSGTNVVRDGTSVRAVDCETTGDVTVFEALFARAIARGLPMVCANPDFVSPPKPGKQTTYQPGHVAAFYEQLGGHVIYYGKPYANHFHACVDGLGLRPERVCHVGDSMHHDVAGALGAGLAVAFVASGIEREKLGLGPSEATGVDLGAPVPGQPALARLFEEFGAVPTHTVVAARWDSPGRPST